MRKVVLFLTSLVLCLCLGLCCYMGYTYYSYDKIGSLKEDINTLDNNIDSTNKEITRKNEEIEKLKVENQEKGNYLELWKKELKKVKQDS